MSALHVHSGSCPPESSCCIEAIIIFRPTLPRTALASASAQVLANHSTKTSASRPRLVPHSDARYALFLYPLSMHFVQGVLKTGNDSNYRAVPKHKSRGIFPVHASWIPLGFWVTLVTLNCAELYRVELSSGDLNVLPTVALNFENLVAKVLPITISSAAMVKEKGRLIGIGIFELDEHFSTLDNPAALCALLYFRHCFLTYRGLEQAFAMLMGDTQASRDRRILVLR